MQHHEMIFMRTDSVLTFTVCYYPQSPNVEVSQSGITTGCNVVLSSARRQNLSPGLSVKATAKQQWSWVSLPHPDVLL